MSFAALLALAAFLFIARSSLWTKFLETMQPLRLFSFCAVMKLRSSSILIRAFAFWCACQRGYGVFLIFLWLSVDFLRQSHSVGSFLMCSTNISRCLCRYSGSFPYCYQQLGCLWDAVLRTLRISARDISLAVLKSARMPPTNHTASVEHVLPAFWK